MSGQGRSSLCVRRYLSESDENEALRQLRDQQNRQQRVTSDDIRLAVRAVASKGGSVALPSDFPPSRWVLEFKRVHGFVQLNSFTFGAFDLPELGRPAIDRQNATLKSTTSLSSGASRDDETDKSEGSLSSSFHNEVRAPQLALLHDVDQRHRRLQQQQQQRMLLVEGRRGWKARDGTREDTRSTTSSGSLDSESGATTATSVGSSVKSAARSGSSVDEVPDNTSCTSTPNEKRGYRLSHTVPAETWEKAIAAVEQQGMSLRAAAKMYGVHFAALHRRVKKRAQGGQSNGTNGYFHLSDEAGITRVVIARAELGVLMTFEELMSLVEAAALRKLPDISVESARKLLTRFQTRNEQSIRHIIVDWPPPRPVAASATVPPGPVPLTSSSPLPVSNRPSQQQYYQEQSNADFGGVPRVSVRRSVTGNVATAAATSAAASRSLFVPPSRVGPLLSRIGSLDGPSKPSERIISGNSGIAMNNMMLLGPSSQRLRAVGSCAHSERDGDPVMVV